MISFMADAFEIHVTRSPICGIDTDIDIAMKTAVRPFPRRANISVFDRIVMDVLDVPSEIVLVA